MDQGQTTATDLAENGHDGHPDRQDEPDQATDPTAESLRERLTFTELQPAVAPNLAAGAVMLLITLMIVLLAALVGGQFASAIPSDSVFSDAINTTTENAGTAFVIFGVSLLAIPTVSVLGYIVMKLGPFIGFNGMSGGDMMRRRR